MLSASQAGLTSRLQYSLPSAGLPALSTLGCKGTLLSLLTVPRLGTRWSPVSEEMVPAFQV